MCYYNYVHMCIIMYIEQQWSFNKTVIVIVKLGNSAGHCTMVALLQLTTVMYCVKNILYCNGRGEYNYTHSKTLCKN